MILLRNPNDNTTKMVEEGVSYQRCFPKDPNGSWCWEVIGQQGPDTEFEAETGIRVGDSIAALTKAFGIKPCSKCEQRRRVLNEIKKRGIAGTLKALKDIGF